MTCGIYMIENLVNGKIYIGQGLDIEKRWKDHKYGLRGNYHENKHLQNAWNKYGEDNFEFTIICECSENQLNTMEEYYIFELMSYELDFGYNKSYGGGSGRPTEEIRKKISESTKIAMNRPEIRKKMSENNGSRRPEVRKKMSEYRKGTTLSEETRKKLSESHKGRTLLEETKKKLSENNARYWKGKHFSEEHRKKISEAGKGRVFSEETRKKISYAQKGEKYHMYGKHHTEETKKKLSEACSGSKNPLSIPVVQLTLEGELVKIYGSEGEAKRSGFSQGNIWSCCRGDRKTHKGYRWMYLSDYEAMKKEGVEN